MLVKVIPIRPIPGILPKNKWIDSEMTLDLNKNEIIHCMQFGNVYDENGDIIDAISVHKTDFDRIRIIKPIKLEPVIIKEVPEMTLPELVEEQVIMGPISIEESIVEPVLEVMPESITVEIEDEEIKEESYFKLEVVSCVKEDNYIILTTQMNTNSKLEGKLYGLFNITSGTRPTIEFNTLSGWTKFNNKFADFETILNGDKLVFRFTPKNDNEFSYKILIKQANEVLVSLEEKINPVEL